MSGITYPTSLVYEDLEAVEELLTKQGLGQHPDLQNALNILISSGGKRIRPILTLLVGHMLDARPMQLITLAAAIEMLHTATLVHDDLIDGSLLRRGLPTLNSQWSPGATVLTGDFIFARAAELAADTESVSVMKLFAQTLGEIVNGEITQLFNNRCQVNREKYFERIYAKTASLFRTSCCAAAMIGSHDENTQSICAFGYEIGIAFQIMDDILDFTGDETKIGKPVGSDLRSGLITLPAIIFFENNPHVPSVKLFLDGGCEALGSEVEVKQLIDAIRCSKAIDESHNEALKHINLALVELSAQPACKERKALEEIARYIIDRSN